MTGRISDKGFGEYGGQDLQRAVVTTALKHEAGTSPFVAALPLSPQRILKNIYTTSMSPASCGSHERWLCECAFA